MTILFPGLKIRLARRAAKVTSRKAPKSMGSVNAAYGGIIVGRFKNGKEIPNV